MKRSIVHYYDVCENDYRFFWDLDHSLAMHAGFWDETTHNLRQALARENEVLALSAGITSSDHILDAGCGVGGSSIFLAQRFGCKVTGITLSEKQAKTAKENAFKYGVETLVDFQIADFCHTPFHDLSFDVVWALESVCHADNKLAFVQEAHRLLKPQGRLVLADGFASDAHVSDHDAKAMSTWLHGWGVEALETLDVFREHLHVTGFKEIHCRDVTKNILPSSKKLHRISLLAFPFSKLGEWIGIRSKRQTQNIEAAYYQYTTLKKGLWSYALWNAVKR